jgi:SOUL heme-binding protein
VKKLLALAFLASCSTQADQKMAPAYTSEAPLPKGWPQPGPYDQATLKNYPTYRAAVTAGKGETGAFLRLFSHIKKQNIPMTAPVSMAMETNDQSMEMGSMAFLYQDTSVGQKGPDGKAIEVRDIPAEKALSYTWMGDDSEARLTQAKIALEAALKDKQLTAKSFRLLGYNGPGTPKMKRTNELQALLGK